MVTWGDAYTYGGGLDSNGVRNAAANTGSGGAARYDNAGNAGDGGSGIVILRYVSGGAAPAAAVPLRSFYGQNLAIKKWLNAAIKNQESAQ
jgi:hypothetical protein